MKFFSVICLAFSLTSCGYYKFRDINLKKKLSNEILMREMSTRDTISYIFLHHNDNVYTAVRPIKISADNSAMIFQKSEVPKQKELLEFYWETEDMNDDMRRSSGRLKPEDEAYVPQIHLYLDRNQSSSDSIISINNEQITKIHTVKKGRLSQFATYLLVSFIIATPFIVILFLNKLFVFAPKKSE